jgi:hypothetical protein
MIKRLLFSIRLWFRPRSSPNLFAYFDGARWRTIDPLAAIYALESHPEYVGKTHFRGIAENDRESIEICAKAVIDVFGAVPYDADTRKGLTIAERVGLLVAFARYLEAVKKNTERSAATPRSMDATSNA